MVRHASELSEMKARTKQSLDEQEVQLRAQAQKQYDQVSGGKEQEKRQEKGQEKGQGQEQEKKKKNIEKKHLKCESSASPPSPFS